MVRKIVFALAVILLVTLCFYGCQSSSQEKRLRQERQLEILHTADKARNKARERADNFMSCMIRFAQQNAQVSVTPSGIAEAAHSSCQFDLDSYKMSRSEFYFSMENVNDISVKSLDGIRDRADQKARIDAQELAEQGRRLVINRVIKKRQE